MIVSLAKAKSFITGSRAYGLPDKKSDIDLVIWVDEKSLTKLELLSDATDDEESNEIRENYETFRSKPLRFGKLNIIACLDYKVFALWRKGTKALKGQAPVSRSFACKYFDKLFIEAGIKKGKKTNE